MSQLGSLRQKAGSSSAGPQAHSSSAGANEEADCMMKVSFQFSASEMIIAM
jgi:hypothetical protein